MPETPELPRHDALFRAFRARGRFGSLDGLRGLAVLFVVWHHTHRGWLELPASRRGYLGVDLFFVLSGFLITTLLLRERDERGAIALGRFYARRTLRIFPLYYGVLLVLTVVFAVAPGMDMARPFLDDLPYYATYTSNWIHAGTFLVLTWSLAAEEQFYLTWAPLLRWLGADALWVVGAVIAVGLAVSFGLLDPLLAQLLGPRFRELDMVQATFDPIAFGVLAGWCLHHGRGFATAARWLGGRGSALLALALVFVTANLTYVEPLGWPRPFVQLAMTALVVACVLREDHVLAPLLRWRRLAWVGKISYGVYLLHMFALQGVRALQSWTGWSDPLETFLLTVVGSLVLAALSFRYLEQPFLRLKGRFASGPNASK